MAICDFCGASHRGGHVRVGCYRFCTQSCADRGRILETLDLFPNSAINTYVENTRTGTCAECGAQALSNIHKSYRIYSVLIYTSWKTLIHYCCQRRGRRHQASAILFSSLLGWWGFPFGILVTPWFIVKNIIEMMRSDDRASNDLERIRKLELASRLLEPAFRSRFEQQTSGREEQSTAGKQNEPEPSESEKSWYVLIAGKQLGPTKFLDLQQLARKGQLPEDAHVWNPNFDDWVVASTVPNLFPQAKTKSDFRVDPIDRTVYAHEPSAGSSIEEDSPRGNYFARHWRGQLPLPVSYWLNTVLGTTAFTIGVEIFIKSTGLGDDFNPTVALIVVIMSWAATLAFSIWQTVGTFRSAAKYKIARPGSYWGGIAQFLLIISLFQSASAFMRTGIPSITEFYKIYAGDEEVGKYKFRVLRDGQEMEFTGGITFGAAKEFDRFVEALGGLKLVHLNSPGGRISEAQKMGEIIRRHGLSTYVSEDCLSACTIIFLNGRDRLINAKSRVGFHQPYFPGMTEESKREAVALEQRRLEQLGVSLMFSRKANTYTPEEMWVPDASELLSEHVATRLVDASDYGISGLGLESLSDVQLQKVLTDIPVYKAIQLADPVTFNDIAVHFISGIRRGIKLAELTDQINPLVETVFTSSLPLAPEEELIAYTNLAIRKLTTLSDVDPANCYLYLNRDKSSSAEAKIINDLLKAFLKEEQTLKASVIGSRLNLRMPTDQQANPLLARLVSKLKLDPKLDASLLNAKEVKPERYRTYCLTSIAMWKVAMDFPRKDRETLLRFLYK
jgi:hypothetical protein